MSKKTEDARDAFNRAIDDALYLLQVHRERNPAAGRRHREAALNRAAIVLAVAAWQSFVVGTAEALLDRMPAPSGPFTGEEQKLFAYVKSTLGRFNVPSSATTLALFMAVGLDAKPQWTLTVWFELQRSKAHAEGVINKSISLTPDETALEVDAWVKSRHKVAHGDVLADSPEFARVLSGAVKVDGTRSVLRRDADRCTQLLREMVRTTADLADRLYP